MYLLWPLYLLSLLSSKHDYFDMTSNGLSFVNIFVEGYNENHICILLSVSTLVFFLDFMIPWKIGETVNIYLYVYKITL